MEHLFKEVEDNFQHCLKASQSEEAYRAIEKLKSSLVAVEEHSDSAQRYSTLFIQIFQFELIACDPVWKQMPRLHSKIGEFINDGRADEISFRNAVLEQGLGGFLKFAV
jgi:hypothetical protein